MFRRLLRLIGLLGVLIAIVWLTREHLLPAPRVSKEPPPHYRSSPPPPPPTTPTPAEPDDLTKIKGIGPVFASRLETMGIVSFAGLASADVAATAESVDTSESNVSDWIAQAEAHLQ